MVKEHFFFGNMYDQFLFMKSVCKPSKLKMFMLALVSFALLATGAAAGHAEALE